MVGLMTYMYKKMYKKARTRARTWINRNGNNVKYVIPRQYIYVLGRKGDRLVVVVHIETIKVKQKML